MNSSNTYLQNLYIHLNTNQSYCIYNTSVHSQPQYTQSQLNQSVYDKLLHDSQNYST
jgi:hypothetical protein